MDQVYLNGAEEVRRAGMRMGEAAADVLQAANIVSEAVARQAENMTAALDRLEALVARFDAAAAGLERVAASGSTTREGR